MEKAFKYIIIIFVACALVGINIAINSPRDKSSSNDQSTQSELSYKDQLTRPKLSFSDQLKLSKIIALCNADLPREVGTIGFLDSLSFADETITYNFRVKGDDKIIQVYSDNYDNFGDVLKYTLVEMNGQQNLGSTLAYFLESHGLNMCFKVSTENQLSMNWNITGEELRTFIDSCKSSPTTALKNVIDMQIKIANLHLPLTGKENLQVASVATNSLVGKVSDVDFLLQSVKCEEDDIIFEYKINKNNMKDIKRLKEKLDDSDFMDAFIQELAQDIDVKEFIGMLAISHSNMVLICREAESDKQVSLKIPYTILRNSSKVPLDLLSIN